MVCWENYRKEQEDSTFKARPGPAENRKIYSVLPEDHAFLLKKNALMQSLISWEGNLSPGVDDPVPRNVGSGHDAVESVSGKPWLSFQASESSDHSVGAHAAPRYSSRGVPNTNIGGRTK